MGDPVTETAHYLASVRWGATDLLLVQPGQREPISVSHVVWRLGRPRSRAWDVLRGIVAVLLAVVR